MNGNYQEGQAGGAFDSTFNTSVSVRGFSPGGEASDLATLTVAPPAFVRPPSQPVMPTPSTSAGEEETWIPASEAPPASLAMSAKAPSLGTLARQGLLVTVRSPRDGQVTVRAVVKSPRRHGLRTAVLATRTVTVRAGVPASVRLKPTTAVAKRLRTNRVYPLRVELDSRQAGVSAKTVTLRVTRR